MSIRRFQVRDVVNTKDEFGARTFALIAITETGYRSVAMKSKKKYNLTDAQIDCKIGELSENDPLFFEEEYDVSKGQDYCLQQAREFILEADKWIALSKLKPNDTICLVHRKNIFQNAVFLGINFNKPLYPIQAKIKGLTHNFKLSSMILQSIENGL